MSNRKVHPHHALEIAVRKLHEARTSGDRHLVKIAEKGLDNARRALKRLRKSKGGKRRVG